MALQYLIYKSFLFLQLTLIRLKRKDNCVWYKFFYILNLEDIYCVPSHWTIVPTSFNTRTDVQESLNRQFFFVLRYIEVDYHNVKISILVDGSNDILDHIVCFNLVIILKSSLTSRSYIPDTLRPKPWKGFDCINCKTTNV